jgi:hypothetical protein
MRRKEFVGLNNVLALAAAVGFATSTAMATMLPVGEAWEIGSWAQRFRDSNEAAFNRIEISMTTSPAFETPGLSGFSDPSWAITDYIQESPTERSYVLAGGLATTSIDFDVLFLGEVADPLVFAFNAYNGQTLIEAAELTWDGATWTVVTTGQTVRPAPPVPEPGTVVAAVLLLLPMGVGALRRLRNRQPAA